MRTETLYPVYEITTRRTKIGDMRGPIQKTSDAVSLVRPILSGLEDEVFLAISMDYAGRPMAIEKFTGVGHNVLIKVRHVFRASIRIGGVGVLVAHNHPANTRKPSVEDENFTREVLAGGLILGVEVHDHIIVTAEDYYSFREHQPTLFDAKLRPSVIMANS